MVGTRQNSAQWECTQGSGSESGVSVPSAELHVPARTEVRRKKLKL